QVGQNRLGLAPLLGEQLARGGFAERFVGGAEIDFGAVAGGEEHRLIQRTATQQTAQGSGDLCAAVRQPLPYANGSGAMVDSYDRERHAAILDSTSSSFPAVARSRNSWDTRSFQNVRRRSSSDGQRRRTSSRSASNRSAARPRPGVTISSSRSRTAAAS